MARMKDAQHLCQSSPNLNLQQIITNSLFSIKKRPKPQCLHQTVLHMDAINKSWKYKVKSTCLCPSQFMLL